MSGVGLGAAEILAQHWMDEDQDCVKCRLHFVKIVDHVAHQLDALKAAGYTVVETQSIDSDDLVDKIAKAVGWCDNPDPDDPEDAIFEVNQLLWAWVRADVLRRADR